MIEAAYGIVIVVCLYIMATQHRSAQNQNDEDRDD